MYSDDIVIYTVMFYIHINIHWYFWWLYEPSVIRHMKFEHLWYDVPVISDDCDDDMIHTVMRWYVHIQLHTQLHTLYSNDDMKIYSDDLYGSDKYHNTLGMTVIASWGRQMIWAGPWHRKTYNGQQLMSGSNVRLKWMMKQSWSWQLGWWQVWPTEEVLIRG